MKHFIIKKLLSIEKMIKVNSLRYTGTVLGCLVLSWGVLWCPVASCGNQTHPLNPNPGSSGDYRIRIVYW